SPLSSAAGAFRVPGAPRGHHTTPFSLPSTPFSSTSLPRVEIRVVCRNVKGKGANNEGGRRRNVHESPARGLDPRYRGWNRGKSDSKPRNRGSKCPVTGTTTRTNTTASFVAGFGVGAGRNPQMRPSARARSTERGVVAQGDHGAGRSMPGRTTQC